jgi:hypothetical protein
LGSKEKGEESVEWRRAPSSSPERKLAEALGRIAAQAGIEIETVGDQDFDGSASFSDLPVLLAVLRR